MKGLRTQMGWLAGACLLAGTGARAQISPPHLAQTPDIHGDNVVFSAEGDLWLGSLKSGTAWRLTTHEGMENRPRFSPDGKSIAFTGQYDGGSEIYVMPTEGGAPRRLTYDPFGAEMVGWTPDGRQILFRSRRATPMVGARLYLVPATGGIPTPLPMEKAAQGAFSPDGHRLAFCRLAMEDHHWKRYRGGQANHLWIADLDKKSFRRINDDTINEQYPVWVGESVFYVSERDGTANLWHYDVKTGHAARLTSHDVYDVKAPASDGKRVIYQWGDGLWIYDLQTGKEQQVKLQLASDRIHARPHLLAGSLGAFRLGPTGKRAVVEGRGQIATIPVEKGDARVIALQTGSRSKQPVWSPDGKTIAFVSDRSGEENIWLAPAGGGGNATPLTNESKLHLDGPLWSPDSKRLAYFDNALALWLVDVDTKTKTEVTRGEYSPITDYRFSPDGKWLAYSRTEGRNIRSLYLYNIAQKQATRLTFPPTRDHDPVFDPTGKYLYFLTERSVRPRGDGFDFQNDFEKTTRLYLIALAADTPSPMPVETDEEPGSVPGDKSAAAKPDEKKPEDKDKNPPLKLVDTKIDLDGIAARTMEIPIAPGDYDSLDALSGKILYIARGQADDDDGPGPGGTLKMFDFAAKKDKETTLMKGVLAYDLSDDHKKIGVRNMAGVQVADAGAPIPPTADRLDLSGWQVTVDPAAEWKQIFEEAWRNHRDTFYDAHLHGMDWEGVRRKYEALLPSIGARGELNEIIGDMQGEMNVSHEFVGGGYERLRPGPAPGFGALGADLAYDSSAKAYRLTHIFPGDGFDADARSPLLLPGNNVREGDFLLTINGTPLQADQDPNALLIGQGGKTVTLQVNSKPTRDGARTVRIKAMSSDNQARYYDWVSRCRAYVEKNGGSNIAYIHLPDMSSRGIAEFTKHFYANLDKDGIILDVRYNGGGIVSGQILERLRRVVFEYDQPRYGKPVPYHYTAYLGRVVAICNEGTASDGEYFCTGLRYMKLGQTVGTRTWGGFMAVSGFSAIDGGFVSTPELGSFSPEGKWLPDGYGFNPDFVVDEDPNAFVAGRDPQLDKAIEVLKDEIKRNPPPHIQRIEPPSKEKAFGPNRK